MNNKIKKYIIDNNMLNKNESVVVGVSGGSDSMCLLSALVELRVEWKLTIYAVHVHHGIRGEEADEDMRYVEEYCRQNNIKCYTYRFDVIREAKDLNMTTEEAGRYLRYKVFDEVAKKHNAKIAVAHNIEDNAETVLFNMFRGTGVLGLCGIVPVRDNIIRPIMCLTKEEIYAYLKDRDISYRVDKSNFTEEYTRNKIRLNMLPYAEKNINAKAALHINSLSENIRETMEFIDEYVKLASDKYVVLKNNEARISLELVAEKKIIVSGVIRYSIKLITSSLKDITSAHIDDIRQLMNKHVGAYICLPYGIRAEKGYNELKIYREDKQTHNNSCKDNCVRKMDGINKGILDITIDEYREYDLDKYGKLLVSKGEYTEEIFEKSVYTKWINCDILKGGLHLRTRQTGDYIVVDSCGSRKKIKDLFIDLKIPKNDRDNVLLLAKEHEILWVIGYRLGYNYKIHKQDENVVKFEYVNDDGGKDGRED